MTTKHNVSKRGRRTTGAYGRRLERRGEHRVEMPTLEALRAKHAARIRETCTTGGDHRDHRCNGHPWPSGGPCDLKFEMVNGVPYVTGRKPAAVGDAKDQDQVLEADLAGWEAELAAMEAELVSA